MRVPRIVGRCVKGPATYVSVYHNLYPYSDDRVTVSIPNIDIKTVAHRSLLSLKSASLEFYYETMLTITEIVPL